jgi:hypothetical protein
MNHDGISDQLQAEVPMTPYWQAMAHAGGYQPHLHVRPPGFPAAHTADGHFTPRSPVVVEFPSQLGAASGSPVNTSVLGSTVQVAEEEDAIDETGQAHKVFQISGMNGEPLAIVQMLK